MLSVIGFNFIREAPAEPMKATEQKTSRNTTTTRVEILTNLQDVVLDVSGRGMKITLIHGIGDGILKAAIRKELDEVLTLRCSYSVGDPAVKIVTIR